MMRAMSLAEIAACTGARPPLRDAPFSAVSTDSRTIARGELFVALGGERFDGHAYIDAALARGAAGIVAAHALDAATPHLVVADTLRALGAIARHNRELFAGRVVALTGSAGKTTTKEMIAAMLAQAGAVLATGGNLNNEVGVPLTLLRIAPSHAFAVIEMGAGKPGDIAYLAAFAQPDVALVTNAMAAHLEGMGSVAGVAATKGAIYEALGARGIAVLNVDDAAAADWRERIGARRTVTVSAAGSAADVMAKRVRVREGFASFELLLPDGGAELTLRVPGVQQVANAVAAAGVAHACGVGLAQIVGGLAAFSLPGGRMDRVAGAGGSVLIDDSYNANPGSVRAAIDTLASFGGTRVLVLGNMAELGATAGELHREVGEHARERGIDAVLALGPHAAAVAQGCGAAGRAFVSLDELLDACRGFDRAGVVMLVKGSRSAGMERVVGALLPAGQDARRAEIH